VPHDVREAFGSEAQPLQMAGAFTTKSKSGCRILAERTAAKPLALRDRRGSLIWNGNAKPGAEFSQLCLCRSHSFGHSGDRVRRHLFVELFPGTSCDGLNRIVVQFA
jgi:hypothetical protein